MGLRRPDAGGSGPWGIPALAAQVKGDVALAPSSPSATMNR
jgi:hypothetical protein